MTGISAEDPIPGTSQSVTIRFKYRIFVHMRIHSRRENNRDPGGQNRRGQQIIRDSRGDFTDTVGGSRANENDIRPLGQPDMFCHHGPVIGKQIDAYRMHCQCLQCAFSQKLLSGICHDDPDIGTKNLKMSQDQAGLISGNTAGDTQQNFFIVQIQDSSSSFL